MKKLVLSISFIAILGFCNATDLDDLTDNQIRAELTDLYFDISDELSENGMVNMKTLLECLNYLNELDNRGYLDREQSKQVKLFNKDLKAYPVDVKTIQSFMKTCIKFTLGMAKTR